MMTVGVPCGDQAGQRGVGLFFLRAEHDDHALAFEHRHLVDFAIFLKVVGKTEQQYFALFLEENGAAFEEHIGFDLCAFLEEADGVFELEVVVMVIGLGSETDFLHNDLGCFGLLFLLAFFLLVEELLVVKHAAHRRLGGGRDLNEIEPKLIGDLQGFLNGVDAVFYIVADETDLAGADVFIDGVWFLLTSVGEGTARAVVGARRARSERFFLHSGGLVSVFYC